jgi:Ca2+:H+ antiporter
VHWNKIPDDRRLPWLVVLAYSSTAQEMPEGPFATMLSVIRSEAAFIVTVASAAILYTVGSEWLHALSNPLIFAGLFVWIFSVMVWSAFAAVRHADSLAELLGEPYGTLILTVSVISIEVSVISAVMLTGDSDPTLPRDTMMAVMMIVLNGMVGVSLLIGGFRYGEQDYNLPGARAFLAVLITLATVALVLPRFTISTSDASLTPRQSVLFSLVTVALYGAFLSIQTIRHSSFFMEARLDGTRQFEHGKHPEGLETRSVSYHAVFLVVTLVPIVLLSKKLAVLVDEGISVLNAPLALGGILVALLVLAPEGMAAFNAAAMNHLQRAVNICLGSALATISLTVPAIVTIGLVTKTHIVLGLDPSEMVLLVLTLMLSVMTFGGTRTNVLQGAVHVVVFFVYLILIFDP